MSQSCLSAQRRFKARACDRSDFGGIKYTDLDNLHLVLGVGPDHERASGWIEVPNVLSLDRREHAAPRRDDEDKGLALDCLDPKQSRRGIFLERLRDP